MPAGRGERRSVKRLRAILLAAALLACGCGASGWQAVPTQSDALAQYLYARDHYYVPAFDRAGPARDALLRQAVDGFQSVVHRFPEDAACTTRALAEYDTGLCQMRLGETERARTSFMRCRDYRRFAASMPAAGRPTLIAVMDRAREEIRKIDGLQL